MTQAFEDYVSEIATEISVKPRRVYEILDRDNPYTKLWRLLAPLGRIDPDRLRLVQGDFNARCARLIGNNGPPSTVSSIHKEATDVVQKILDGAPKCERKTEILELINELNKELGKCE